MAVQVIQQKTSRPVQFEITKQACNSIGRWMAHEHLASDNYLFLNQIHDYSHLSTRRYAWIVHRWVEQIGLDPIHYGTNTMLRTKVALGIPADKKLKGGITSFGPR